jgi:hypothetical protein
MVGSLGLQSWELEEQRVLMEHEPVPGELSRLFEMPGTVVPPSPLFLAERWRVYRSLPPSGRLLGLATFLAMALLALPWSVIVQEMEMVVLQGIQ